MSEHITLTQLAKEWGLDRSNTRKFLVNAGFAFARIRTSESRNQMTLALTVDDAEIARELRQSRGFTSERRAVTNTRGYFYVVRLVPELDPNRVKLGYATNAAIRLAAHRTASPTAELLRSWPCRQCWEQAAIASLARIDSTLIANEVYRCGDVDALLERGDTFFALMPEP